MTASMAGAGARMSRVRWTVCALLFFATTISYLDRQVLSFLAKTLETSLGWNSIQYGYITAAFSAAYAIGLLIAGRLMDKLGTRRGFALAMGVWSLAAAAHAAAATKLALRSAAFAVHRCDAAYGFVWGLFHGGGGAGRRRGRTRSSGTRSSRAARAASAGMARPTISSAMRSTGYPAIGPPPTTRPARITVTRWASAAGRGRETRDYGFVEVGGKSLAEVLVSEGLAQSKGVAPNLPDGEKASAYMHKLQA